MKTITVVWDGETKELGEAEINELLIQKALEVARNSGIRWHLSNVRRAMIDVTNKIYRGQQIAQGSLDIEGAVGHVFPESRALQEKLIRILSDYCVSQENKEPRDWEAGWENEVVPQIQALAS